MENKSYLAHWVPSENEELFKISSNAASKRKRDVFLRPSLFWDVKPRRLVVIDVPEQPVGPIFRG
jgi:hypothetical protein